MLSLIKEGIALLGDRGRTERRSVAPDTFYEVDGGISATPTGLALIGYLKNVENALAQYRSWQQAGGRWEEDFIQQISELLKIHGELLHCVNRSEASGHDVIRKLERHGYTYDGWIDVYSQNRGLIGKE